MTRPKWLAMLVLVLAVAAAFAALAQWQIDSAVRSAQHAEEPSLGPTTLGDAATPQAGLPDNSIGRTVSFEGIVDPRDFDIVTDRLQGDELGYWVIGHVHVTNDGAEPYAMPTPGASDEGDQSATAPPAPGLAVTFGWAPTREAAEAAADDLREATPPIDDAEPVAFEGRLEYGQQPALPSTDGNPHELGEMAPAYLVNRWAEPGPTNYGSYVILDLADDERAGLAPVAVVSVGAGGGLNWLNVFYALEWVVFAFFAFYVWWRLVRAEYDREREAAFSNVNPNERAEREIRLAALRRARDARGRDDHTAPGA